MVWRGREYLQPWGKSLREDLPQLRKRILEYIAEEGAFTRSYVDAWDLVNESTPEIYPGAWVILTHDVTTTSSGEESSKYPYRLLFRQRSFPTTRFPNRRRNTGGAMRIRSCLEKKGAASPAFWPVRKETSYLSARMFPDMFLLEPPLSSIWTPLRARVLLAKTKLFPPRTTPRPLSAMRQPVTA